MALAAALVVGVHGRAAAFVTSDEFSAYPDKKLGGGGGRYFTGSPADGFDCSVCHTAPTAYHYPLQQRNLPLDGYIPSKTYEITLSWPEAALAQDQAKSRGLTPQIALMVEFVSEDGGDAGKLQFMNASARKDGLCPLLPGQTEQSFAGSILATTKGKPVTVITTDVADADPEKGVCQTGGEEEQRRCLIWVEPCGAQNMKFKWTAPPQLHGPVWFSAGMVVTLDKTSKPNDSDYTTLLSTPMNAATDGKTYEQNLETGCSISGAPHKGRAGVAGVLVMLSALGFVHRLRRRQRHPGLRGVSALGIVLLGTLSSALGAVGCSEPPVAKLASGTVGRFEPVACEKCDMLGPTKCRLGTVDDWKMCTMAAAAGSGARTNGAAGAGALLAASALGSATGAGAAPVASDLINGQLKISFVSSQPPGTISSHMEDCMKDLQHLPCIAPNYTATWIEDMDGHFVKMLEHNGGPYQLSLKSYIRLGQDCVCEEPAPDVITTPSINMHRQHDLTWNGRNAKHEPVPYGMYNLCIELAIDEAQIWPVKIPFTITAAPTPSVAPAVVPPPVPAVPHNGVTLTFIPNQ